MDILETNFLHTLGVPNIYQKNHFLKAKFNNNSETTEVKNLKFGDMKTLYMKLYTCIFGVACGLWQMRQKQKKT